LVLLKYLFGDINLELNFGWGLDMMDLGDWRDNDGEWYIGLDIK